MPPKTIENISSLTKMQASGASPLACPVCFGEIAFPAGSRDRLVCAGCGRDYPIVDGIPVLIAG